MPDCIFCKIAAREIPANIVWENERFVVFPDIKPLNPGHLLIVPKQHAETVYDLPDELYTEGFALVRTLSAPLARATAAQKVGIVVEGFGVDHAHIHLVPLHGIHEIDPRRAHEADPKDLEEMAETIKKEITNHK